MNFDSKLPWHYCWMWNDVLFQVFVCLPSCVFSALTKLSRSLFETLQISVFQPFFFVFLQEGNIYIYIYIYIDCNWFNRIDHFEAYFWTKPWLELLLALAVVAAGLSGGVMGRHRTLLRPSLSLGRPFKCIWVHHGSGVFFFLRWGAQQLLLPGLFIYGLFWFGQVTLTIRWQHIKIWRGNSNLRYEGTINLERVWVCVVALMKRWLSVMTYDLWHAIVSKIIGNASFFKLLTKNRVRFQPAIPFPRLQRCEGEVSNHLNSFNVYLFNSSWHVVALESVTFF